MARLSSRETERLYCGRIGRALGPKNPALNMPISVRARLFSKGHISKRIPPDFTVTQYLGFAPRNTWESGTNSLNPKYWVTSPLRNRCDLEKRGVPSHFSVHPCHNLLKPRPLPLKMVDGRIQIRISKRSADHDVFALWNRQHFPQEFRIS